MVNYEICVSSRKQRDYWRDSAIRHEKIGGSGGMLPLANFENLSCLGGKHQDFIVVNIVRKT